jgi:hypothetical protein
MLMLKPNKAADAMSGLLAPRPAPEAPPARAPKPPKTYIKCIVYINPAAKRRIEEIAFARRVKLNDVYLEAFRQYLEREGCPGLL